MVETADQENILRCPLEIIIGSVPVLINAITTIDPDSPPSYEEIRPPMSSTAEHPVKLQASVSVDYPKLRNLFSFSYNQILEAIYTILLKFLQLHQDTKSASSRQPH